MKKYFLFVTIFFIIAYLGVNYSIGNKGLDKLKDLISNENKFLIKKYLFPYKYTSQLENAILLTQSRSPIHEVFLQLKRKLILRIA